MDLTEDASNELTIGINAAIGICHSAAIRRGWWNDIDTGERKQRNRGEMIALMHSELSEALEGERKNIMDQHLPHRRSAEVELADLLIRVFDYAGGHGYDLASAMIEKLNYNATRADHDLANRKASGGKQF